MTRIRRERGMKQKDLLAKLQAEGMDITGSTLSKIEGQSRMITDKRASDHYPGFAYRNGRADR